MSDSCPKCGVSRRHRVDPNAPLTFECRSVVIEGQHLTSDMCKYAASLKLKLRLEESMHGPMQVIACSKCAKLEKEANE